MPSFLSVRNSLTLAEEEEEKHSADVPLTVTVAPKENSAAAADVSPEAVYWTDPTTFDVDKCLNLTNRL